jgi:hypothetical protein
VAKELSEKQYFLPLKTKEKIKNANVKKE